jgi:hypothetical protein
VKGVLCFPQTKKTNMGQSQSTCKTKKAPVPRKHRRPDLLALAETCEHDERRWMEETASWRCLDCGHTLLTEAKGWYHQGWHQDAVSVAFRELRHAQLHPDTPVEYRRCALSACQALCLSTEKAGFCSAGCALFHQRKQAKQQEKRERLVWQSNGFLLFLPGHLFKKEREGKNV